MIKITTAEWKQNPNHIQALAEKQPVLLTHGDKKQVLMDYDEYKKLAKVDDEKPFISAYDVLLANVPKDLANALAQLDDDELEDDNKSYTDASEFLAKMMSGLTDEQQELIANADIEFDMSFSESR